MAGQHQVALFPSPVNSVRVIDANTVRTNDNITVQALNAHDADTSIHMQSGTLAARPTTATEGTVYVGTDTLFMYIYTSGAWKSVPKVIGNQTVARSVISGADWVARDLVADPSYVVTVAAGVALVNGQAVSWPSTSVTTPATNATIVVTDAGVIQAVGYTGSETLPAANALVLFRTYVDIPTYGARIYAVIDCRTWVRTTPIAPLHLQARVAASQITSGAWAGATAMNSTGDINWYFGNIGLYPFCEDLPAQVEDHLDVQIAAFYGASGTASTNWTALHGTTWSNYYNWPYDVATPRTTPVIKRADSHDAYASTFAWLAARYATVGGAAALTWWDTNVAAIQNALYWNILTKQRLVASGAGYMTDTFQDPTIYPITQTLDNIEVYRGVTDALALMTSRGGAQATWAAAYSSTAANILAGIEAMWLTGDNTLSQGWDYSGSGVRVSNPLNRWYPDFVIGLPASVYDVPLAVSSVATSIERIDRVLALVNANCPDWWRSREYDPYPWGVLAGSLAKLGLVTMAEEWLYFVQRHVAVDSTGYFLIHDVGWARYVERLLARDSTL